jgi:hypothetical protein
MNYKEIILRKRVLNNKFIMKNFKLFPLIFLVVLLLGIGCQGQNGTKNIGNCYYVNVSGNDLNPGSINKPWKTLEKISITHLSPGDTVLLEGGAVFTGTIRLDSLHSGDAGEKVTLSSYGKGKAIIDGARSEGIIADNCNHFIIRDLIIEGSGRKNGNITDGVYIKNSNDFIIDSLEISGFQHSGLHIHICSNVRITKIYSHNNGFAGINITGTTIYDSANYDNENVYIGYCTAENNPGDPTVNNNHSGNGILASSVRNGRIEYCEAFNNGWDMPWTGNGPVGIWIWDCRNFIIQYCISHDNKTNPVAKDGGGFDLDGGVSNSTIQYCISFNNQGAGIGLFEFGAAKPWQNNVIRYNISQNDGIVNEGSLAIWRNETAGSMKNCEIYNNTFYNDTARGTALSIITNPPGFNFRNNIFIFSGPFLNPGQKLLKERFQGNCYWNLSGNQSIVGYRDLTRWAKLTGNEMVAGNLAGKYTDPCLFNPGKLTLTDPTRITEENLSGYRPKPQSVLIDQGLDLKRLFNIDVGVNDIIGTIIPQNKRYDIGALEYYRK